jgi:hypothetical protein
MQLANKHLNEKLARLGLKFGKIPKEVSDKINKKKKPNPIEKKVSCLLCGGQFQLFGFVQFSSSLI